VVYWIISTAINTQTRVVLMMLGWFLWNLKMSQHGFRSWAMTGFAFRDWGVTGGPGWFQNSGEFGIQMCLVMPISLYFAFGVRQHVSKWVFMALLVLPFTAVTGAIASSSRGALLGMAAVGLWMLARSKYKVRATVALLAVGSIAYLFVPAEQKERLSASGEDGTSTSRMKYWERGIEFANDHPVLGIGYANWIPYYTRVWESRLAERERIQLPHNLFIEAWAELGYTGLAALLFLIFATFYLNARTRALARRFGEKGYLSEQLAWGFDGGLVGYLVSGFFVTVLYYPYLWVNLGMTVALHLSVARAVRAAQQVRAR
jgi:O-antigen ligase